jgi:DNA-binding MarR family transcriptional regulator
MRWIKNTGDEDGPTIARLRLLWTLETQGSLIMSDLKDQLGITARSVTSLVDALEADGHVRREPHPDDRRATLVEPTEAGHEAIQRAQARHREHVAVLFEPLDPDDQRTLLRLMRTVMAEVQDRLPQEGAG